MMDKQKMYDWISSLTDDIAFTYKGKHCLIMPYSAHKILLSYGDQDRTYRDIDTLMVDKFFEGKALVDILDQIEFD